MFTQSSSALPRFALMTGTKCGSCHVNPTGGLMRNEFGVGYSMEKLPLAALKDSEFTFSSKLTDNISIGGDYRSQFIYDGGTRTTSFQAMTTTIYGSIMLNKKITFFFKQDIVNSTYGSLGGPEVYGIAKVIPGWYIKGGDFLPNYGWRLDDHTSYVRGGDLGFIKSLGVRPGLLFIPDYKDIGVEIGGTIEGLFVTAGIFNGTGNTDQIKFSKNKAYAVKTEYMGSISDVNFRIGASGYGFNAFSMGGFTAGIGTGDIVILGEVDWTKNYNVDPVNNPGGYSMAAYGEIDVRAIQGLWLIGKYDMFDAIQGASNDEISRITLGIECFPLSFVEIRPQYRINMETPSVSNDQALVQMHLWF
jgi:hypothetical protein